MCGKVAIETSREGRHQRRGVVCLCVFALWLELETPPLSAFKLLRPIKPQATPTPHPHRLKFTFEGHSLRIKLQLVFASWEQHGIFLYCI